MKSNSEAKIGDYVEVHTGTKIYEGILLEVPENEKGIVLVKLNSGYNVGVNKRDISEIKKIKNAEVREEKKGDLKKDSKKPNIAIIMTGGTIASKLDSKTGGVKWLTEPNEFFRFYPELFERVNVAKLEVPFMKASEDMDFKDWKKIASIVVECLNDSNIQGVIVTHGTDTLHYTSSALSFFLRELNKPVVLTYSQRSIDRGSSDANLNLKCAALVAISDIAEVMLVGHANSEDNFCYAMPGTKTRKLHSSRRDAFKIVNAKPFAKIYEDKIEILSKHNLRDNRKKTKLDNKFEEKIALIKFYPGQSPDILDYYLKNKYRGIIIEMTGLGHVATMASRNGWTKKLKEVQDKGLIVCAVAQTINGRLNPLVYSNGRELMETGVIYLEDMLSETAFVKLGWVLGKTTRREEVKKLMLTNIIGELNSRLED